MQDMTNTSVTCYLLIILLVIPLGIKGNDQSGICVHYQGVCEKQLNSTAPRFINTTLGLNGTESIAIQFLEAVQPIYNEAKKSKKCKKILENSVCFFLFPLCSAQGERLEYCQEDCKHLFEICANDLNRLVGAGKFILHGKVSGTVFHFDECKDLKKSSEGDGTCQHLPYIDIPSKQSDSEMLDTLIIVIIAIGVPVLALLLILCGIHHRNLMRKARLHSIHYENGKDDASEVKNARISHVISMRDRIREWKVAPSEMTELMDICKSRGVLEIPVDNIEYLKDLGAGQYGLVFQGKVNDEIKGETSRIVAVKTLREGSSHDAIKEFCQEVNIMSTFSHPNVVKLIGVSLAGEPYCMIFEFVELGDLASFLRNCDDTAEEKNSAYPKLTVTDQLAMAVQIASGMKYISAIHCVHRDLAARNCLVGRGLIVKISDFGLTRDMYDSEYYRMDKTRMLPVRWLPPEAFVDGKFTTYSDVYSYGVLLWEIFTFAKLPYEDYDNSKTMELILEGNLLSKPDSCPTSVYDIMLKCWHSNPEKRILFPEIIYELCSLDDFGHRFEAQDDKMQENFKTRTLEKGSPLSYANEMCNVSDEQPLNFTTFPACQPTTGKPSRYAPLHDSKAAVQGHTNELDGPRAVHVTTPPPDNLGTREDNPRLYDDVCPDDHEETCDVPPEHEDDDQETQAAPSIPPHQHEDASETYDVPPESHHYSDGQEEAYDVPPPREGTEETYDVPPKHEPEDIYQNSLQVTAKHGHYSEPQSPFQKQRNEDPISEGSNIFPSSRNARNSYENVDFDGKPLITS